MTSEQTRADVAGFVVACYQDDFWTQRRVLRAWRGRDRLEMVFGFVFELHEWAVRAVGVGVGKDAAVGWLQRLYKLNVVDMVQECLPPEATAGYGPALSLLLAEFRGDPEVSGQVISRLLERPDSQEELVAVAEALADIVIHAGQWRGGCAGDLLEDFRRQEWPGHDLNRALRHAAWTGLRLDPMDWIAIELPRDKEIED